jgi:branched-chain amino acid transport system permease protein
MSIIEWERDRIVLRLFGVKWDWAIEPRYWRPHIIGIGILVLTPIILYFVYPALLATFIEGSLLPCIVLPVILMLIGTGRFNFGPQFFVGVGGFTAGLLSIHFGLGPGITLIAAAAAGLVTGLIFSPLTLLAGGIYFALLTLLLPLIFLEVTFVFEIFKGDTGLSGIPFLFNFPNFTLNQLLYAFAALALMLIYLAITDRLLRSRYALQMAAINDDEEVANGLGVNISRIKILSFIGPAVMISIVGWFYAHYFGAFSGITYLPMTFMMKVFMALVIGGRGAWAIVLGGYVVTLIEVLLIRFAGDWSPILFPIIMLTLLLIFREEGLFGLYRKRHYRDYKPHFKITK